MTSVLGRLYRIAKSNVLSYAERFSDRLDNEPVDDTGQETFKRESSGTNDGDSGEFRKSYTSDIPRQVIEDLALFKLQPPSCLAEVKKARNREIKKYHSDRFMNDPEKLKTSKEIMQMINAAYDRLKKYYEKEK